jgi:anti-sigma B factor antagonist
MYDPFYIEEEPREEVRIVSVSGELDLASAPKLGTVLEVAASDPDRALVVDLTACSFIDSTGIRTLLSGARAMADGLARVAVVCRDGPVQAALALTGFDKSVRIFDEVEAAVLAACG